MENLENILDTVQKLVKGLYQGQSQIQGQSQEKGSVKGHLQGQKSTSHNQQHVQDTCFHAIYPRNGVPQFGVSNDYIHDGYRPPLSYRKCLLSAFAWNNETLNIWTHVVGLAVFVVQMLRFNFVILPDLQEMDSYHFLLSSSSSSLSSSSSSSWWTWTGSLMTWSPLALTRSIPFIWNLSIVCFGASMAFSAGFHIFACHSLEVSTRWLGLDFTGMSVATLGCYSSGIFVAFACHPFWRDFYVTCVITMLLLIVVLPICLDSYWDPDWVWIRAAVQISAIVFGVIPIHHAIALEGGLSSPFGWLFVRSVFDLYFYAALSFFFYVTKFPERLFPGQFDFFGQSHQIWHFFIFYTLYRWHDATLSLLRHRCQGSCFSPPPPPSS